MIRFEKKDLPRQTSDPGPDPLSRFANHGIRGIHGKGAQILMGLHSACSVCSPAVATCRQTVEALLATHHRLAADGYVSTVNVSRSPAVGTCRQTVEALLAHPPPLGSGWLRLGSGWLRFGNQPGWAKPWMCMVGKSKPQICAK